MTAAVEALPCFRSAPRSLGCRRPVVLGSPAVRLPRVSNSETRLWCILGLRRSPSSSSCLRPIRRASEQCRTTAPAGEPTIGRRWTRWWSTPTNKGLVVLMAGVADPADRGGCHVLQSYPQTTDSLTFAKNLAARLAGNHVIFSINFDDWPGTVLDASIPGPGTVDSTTLAVGPALKSVVPHHLVVNHLAGSAQVGTYTPYQLPWLDFQLFQSGHASNVPTACPGKSGTTWQAQQQCAVSRAIDITKGLRAASPLKPVVNGEGGYDTPDVNASPPDNRYGMRHTAYASLLNGAAGFTAGVDGKPPLLSITRWDRNQGHADNALAIRANLSRRYDKLG